MAKNKLPFEPMTGKFAYVEDCSEEDHVDTNSVIPQSQKRVNFAVKLPQNRDNDSTLDSGYQSWIGEKNKHKTKTLGKESHASHRVEIKIKTSGKSLERESRSKNNGTAKKRTKEKVRLQSVHDKSRPAVPSREALEVTNDTGFTRDNGNVPGSYSVCDCQECQQALFAQATAAQQPSYIPRPHSQAAFHYMTPEILPNSTFVDVRRSNRPHNTEADDGFRASEPGPGEKSTRYETFSPSNFKTDEHGNSSYRRSPSPEAQYYPKGNFYSNSPIYLNVAKPIDGLDIPYYQLPSYQELQSYAVPFYPPVSEQLHEYDWQNMFSWWPLNQVLPENNCMYPFYALNGVHSLEWDMQHESKQQASPYLPPQYSIKNSYPIFRPAVPHTSPNTSTFMSTQYKVSQTMDNTNVNSYHPPLNPPIRPQTAASFISTKDHVNRDFLSRAAKTKAQASAKQEKNRQFRESNGHNPRGTTLVNQHDRINTVKPSQNTTESNDKKRDYPPGKINDYVRHKTSTYNPSQTNPDCHTRDRRQKATKNDGSSVRSHPLTKDALAKLNKEHGDDIDSKLQGICRANSSRSIIFDEGNVIIGNKGTKGRS